MIVAASSLAFWYWVPDMVFLVFYWVKSAIGSRRVESVDQPTEEAAFFWALARSLSRWFPRVMVEKAGTEYVATESKLKSRRNAEAMGLEQEKGRKKKETGGAIRTIPKRNKGTRRQITAKHGNLQPHPTLEYTRSKIISRDPR